MSNREKFRKPKIFISYAREDEDKVIEIYNRLKRAHCDPWLDKKDILPGQRWKDAIRKAIKSADFFLACISSTSTSKIGFVQKELRDALEILEQHPSENIYLIPVRLEPCEVPEKLTDHNWVNHYEENGIINLLRSIQMEWTRRGITQESEDWARSAGVPSSLLHQVTNKTRSKEIIKIERRLKTRFLAMDGLILLWMASSKEGLPFTAVEVHPSWRPIGKDDSIRHLPQIGKPFKNYIKSYWDETKTRFPEANYPKIWLKSLKSPFTDRPVMRLEVGRTDYWSTKCLESALLKGDLLKEYERGELSPIYDTPGLIAVASVLLTNDDHLIIAQRQRKKIVDFAADCWTPTFEEQWNPLLDEFPHKTVLRGMKEEFNLDQDHGVGVGPNSVSLYAVGREWGEFYNTVLIYVVQLSTTARKVLDCWQSTPPPPDRDEHIAVAAVPLVEKGRRFLMDLISMKRSEKLSVKRLREVSGDENIVGTPSDHLIFPTHGRAKIIMGLFAKGYL